MVRTRRVHPLLTLLTNVQTIRDVQKLLVIVVFNRLRLVPSC